MMRLAHDRKPLDLSLDSFWSIEPFVRVGRSALAVLAAVSVLSATAIGLPTTATMPATITIDGDTIPIVAPQAGVVSRLAVVDGQHVAAGDILSEVRNTARMDDMAQRMIAIAKLEIEQARLIAERDRHDDLPARPTSTAMQSSTGVTSDIDAYVATQRELFDSRRQDLENVTSNLRERVTTLDRDIDSLTKKLAASLKDRDRNERELSNVRPSFNKGDFSQARMGDLERQSIGLHSAVAKAKADLAKLKDERPKVAAELSELNTAFQRRVISELGVVREKLRIERTAQVQNADRPAVSQVSAQTHGRVKFVGRTADGVAVASGQHLFDIVPDNRSLLVSVSLDRAAAQSAKQGASVRVRYRPDDLSSAVEVDGVVSDVTFGAAHPDEPTAEKHVKLVKVTIQVTSETMQRVAPALHPETIIKGEVVLGTVGAGPMHRALAPLAAAFGHQRMDGIAMTIGAVDRAQ